MELIQEVLLLTRGDTITGVALRGLIWLVAVLIFAAGIDNNYERGRIKAEVGWFFMFIVSTGVLSYFIFGFAPTF